MAVKALCKKRLWQEALNREGAFTAIFPRGVRAAPLPALVPAFATFAQGLAWQHALLLLQELRTVQISRTGRSSRNPMRRHMKSLTAAISACTKSDQWDQALLLLSVFRADAVQPNATRSEKESHCMFYQKIVLALVQKLFCTRFMVVKSDGLPKSFGPIQGYYLQCCCEQVLHKSLARMLCFNPKILRSSGV